VGCNRGLAAGTLMITVRRRTALPRFLILVVLVLVALPQAASARWSRVSFTRSTIEPYFVCPGDRHGLQCELIEDPTTGSSRRGPVSAGAITKGPEQQVSPALSGSGVSGGYSPEDLRGAYDLPSASAGSGQTVAVVDAYDDPNAESDLAAYRSEYKIPACTAAGGCFRKVDQTGGTSYPAPDPEWVPEISIDLDMVSAICPSCHILLVEARDNLASDLAASENEAAALGATEISNSFGVREPSENPEYASAFDHPGIPITVAAGDQAYGVSSPASNPHVIAVGGTSLTPATNSRGWTETVWYSANGGEISGTGSGCSLEAKPPWQTDAGCRYRTTDDVAAVADPNTPVSFYDSYEATKPWNLAGGTSVAAPIIAAAMALANPYTRSFEGAEALYLEAAANGTGVLDDVLSGSNGSCGEYLCQAGPGYDGPTGLGSLYGAPSVPPPPATPPLFVTEAASSLTTSTATLNGRVDPDGGSLSECNFEYGLTSAYGSSAACSPLPASGASPVAVSASVVGLAANTTYHFRISVAGSGGSGRGLDQTLKTLSLASPAAYTEAATSVTQASAILHASVNPNGLGVSECRFEYGSAGSAPCASLPASGQAPVAVSASISGLAPSTAYYFRIVAGGPGGTSYGALQLFTTSAPATLEPQGITGVLSQQTHKAVPDVELVGRSLTASASGAVTLRLSCPATEKQCSGTVALRTLAAVRAGTSRSGKGKAAILTLGQRTFTDLGGHTKTVIVYLLPRARAFLARAHTLRARATIIGKDELGATHTARTIVTLRAAKGARRPGG
jgi:hypothetical protein